MIVNEGSLSLAGLVAAVTDRSSDFPRLYFDLKIGMRWCADGRRPRYGGKLGETNYSNEREERPENELEADAKAEVADAQC